MSLTSFGGFQLQQKVTCDAFPGTVYIGNIIAMRQRGAGEAFEGDKNKLSEPPPGMYFLVTWDGWGGTNQDWVLASKCHSLDAPRSRRASADERKERTSPSSTRAA